MACEHQEDKGGVRRGSPVKARVGCNGETVSSGGVGRRQACRRSTEQCGTVVVRADAGNLLPNKAERRWGDGSVRCLSSEHKDLCCIPGIHVKCQVWQSTVHTCDSTLGKQREKDPWDLLAASLATSTSSTFCQRSCLRKLGRE